MMKRFEEKRENDENQRIFEIRIIDEFLLCMCTEYCAGIFHLSFVMEVVEIDELC